MFTAIKTAVSNFLSIFKVARNSSVAHEHPQTAKIIRDVTDYFLKNWKFRSAKAHDKFIATDFARLICMALPHALEERLMYVSKLIILCYLIDDELDKLSYSDGSSYTAKLIRIIRQEKPAGINDLSVLSNCAEIIMYEVWEGLRAQDYILAEAMVEPTINLLLAQTDREAEAAALTSLGPYLAYRRVDFGADLVFTSILFSLNLHLTPAELSSSSIRDLERNCANHFGIVNDIMSWEKEVRSSKTKPKERVALCSSVQVVTTEVGISHDAAKRVLWAMVHEFEKQHNTIEATILEARNSGCDSRELKNYVTEVGFAMKGNMEWTKKSLRYRGLRF